MANGRHSFTFLIIVKRLLQLRRFNERQDRVLKAIVEHLQQQCTELPGATCTCTYSFPASVVPTDLRPDLVAWSDWQRVVVPVELTICFETNFVDAGLRKTNKYEDLLEACRANGYTTGLVTLEVGSRGSSSTSRGFSDFECFSLSKAEKKYFIRLVRREAILG